ncbi:hypothetical protein AAFP30_06055 [Gordonia sp. CPCC 205515]|uniref:hypothetical protein n=1 Tax=Gordonia sp. CPCC 205515 TaxID=3140791 RepID=UPI003AF3B38E
MRDVFVVLAGVVAVAAAGCALTAAYVYLRNNNGRAEAERRARRWLVATAVFGVSAVVLRFVTLLA